MFEQLGMSGISDEDIEMVPMLSLDEDEDAQSRISNRRCHYCH